MGFFRKKRGEGTMCKKAGCWDGIPYPAGFCFIFPCFTQIVLYLIGVSALFPRGVTTAFFGGCGGREGKNLPANRPQKNNAVPLRGVVFIWAAAPH